MIRAEARATVEGEQGARDKGLGAGRLIRLKPKLH